MARRFCSRCGAALEFSVQKFCTSCGATLPDTVPAAGPGSQVSVTAAGSGIPVRVFVIASYNWSSTDEIAERAVTGWMNSPGHRQNILTPRYEIEGIGVAFSADNKIYITENFC